MEESITYFSSTRALITVLKKKLIKMTGKKELK